MNLANHLLPNTCGLLWFTKGSLSERPSPFNELDYYLDGLLTNILLENREATEQKHFLTTTHFGRPFFLAHFQVSTPDQRLKKDIKEVYELALKLRFDRGQLLVIGDGLEKIQQELKVFLKDFELEYLKS